MNWIRVVGALGLLLGFVGSTVGANATPILQVNGGGILTGVQDIVVGSATYDVSFVDGTCADVFGVCDQAHFTFPSQSLALSASSQLFAALEAPFDFDNSKIAGCGYPLYCDILTPYATTVTPADTLTEAIIDFDAASDALDQITPLAFATNNDASSIVYVWALWSTSSVAPDAVPEPSTLPILGAGLLGLFFIRRRKAKIELAISHPAFEIELHEPISNLRVGRRWALPLAMPEELSVKR